MSVIAAQRARFAATAVTTATPQRLVVMLYERLVLDLQRAEDAQGHGDLAAANGHLQHAQDVVSALAECLDVEAWEGAPGLMALYDWLGAELVEANITKDAARTAACRRVVEPLRDAWRGVAAGSGAPQPGGDGVQVTA